jgi:recombination protein RecT
MALKTVFKRLSKWMPLSSEFATAVAHDTSVRTDITSSVSEVVPTYVDAEIATEAELTQGELPTPTVDVVVEEATA